MGKAKFLPFQLPSQRERFTLHCSSCVFSLIEGSYRAFSFRWSTTGHWVRGNREVGIMLLPLPPSPHPFLVDNAICPKHSDESTSQTTANHIRHRFPPTRGRRGVRNTIWMAALVSGINPQHPSRAPHPAHILGVGGSKLTEGLCLPIEPCGRALLFVGRSFR